MTIDLNSTNNTHLKEDIKWGRGDSEAKRILHSQSVGSSKGKT